MVHPVLQEWFLKAEPGGVKPYAKAKQTGKDFFFWVIDSFLEESDYKKPVILEYCFKAISFPFITLFWNFLRWYYKYFQHLFVLIGLSFLSSLLTWDYAAESRLFCAILKLNQQPPELWKNPELTGFHVATRFPALLMIHLYQFAITKK